MFESRRDELLERAQSRIRPIIAMLRARLGKRTDASPPAAAWPAPKAPQPMRAADSVRPPAFETVASTDASDAEIERYTSQILTADTWQARVVAATALGELRGDRVVDALVRAVRDPSSEVAVAAVEALACQPDPRAAADLREVLRETAGFIGPFTRAAAVDAIVRCQGLTALPLLLDTFHDNDAEVSMAAIIAAAKLAPKESASRLRALLEDRSGYYLSVVRITTAKALERAGELEVERAQRLLATETNEGVRAVLVRAASVHA